MKIFSSRCLLALMVVFTSSTAYGMLSFWWGSGPEPWVCKSLQQDDAMDTTQGENGATADELDSLLKTREYKKWEDRVNYFLIPAKNSAGEKMALQYCYRYLYARASVTGNPYAAHMLINHYYKRLHVQHCLEQKDYEVIAFLILLQLTVLTSKAYLYTQSGLDELYKSFQHTVLLPLFAYYKSVWLSSFDTISYQDVATKVKKLFILMGVDNFDFAIKPDILTWLESEGIGKGSELDLCYNDLGLAFKTKDTLIKPDFTKLNSLIFKNVKDEVGKLDTEKVWPFYLILGEFSTISKWSDLFNYKFDFTLIKQ